MTTTLETAACPTPGCASRRATLVRRARHEIGNAVSGSPGRTSLVCDCGVTYSASVSFEDADARRAP